MAATTGTVRAVGSLLPADILAAVTSADLPGAAAADYGLPNGETIREAANRSWDRLRATWQAFRRLVPAGEPVAGAHTETTRNRWLRVLFEELGYGRLPAVPGGGLSIDGDSYPVSHLWQRTPIHLLGVGVALDHRTAGVAGAARRAPHSLVQELLNRSPDYLWAFVTNGLRLRLLRDSASLVRQSYLEFDLAGMFDGEVFADFVLLWQICHASRVEPRPDPSAAPETCWLEVWRAEAATRGTRALSRLRAGVTEALRILGRGFLTATPSLRGQLRDGTLTAVDYHRLLLRLVYQLLILFVAEDRDLLHPQRATAAQRRRYANHFSTAALRRRALGRRTADRHTDRWAALRLVTNGLGMDGGLPALGLPALGGIYKPGTLGPLEHAALANRDLLAAVRALAATRDEGGNLRPVDYRNLDAEELGSVYESLLELVPTYSPATGAYKLETGAGSERKTSGSYYTPSGLVEILLDEALDPVLDAASRADNPEQALLAVTVCDPACGSGHFLVAAARRIARSLAAARTGEAEPPEPDLRSAIRDVVTRCLYGVDLNPLAAELAKVALWLEALEPELPFSFLDNHIKVGNSLLGTTPRLVAAGLPDAAFTALPGDDPKVVSLLKRRNRKERSNANQIEAGFGEPIDGYHAAFRALADEPERTLLDVDAKEVAYRAAEDNPNLARTRLAADAWCAAFAWPRPTGSTAAITSADIRRVVDLGAAGLTVDQLAEVERLREHYQFFHWPLEFPDILPGGFSCVIGNPPWDQIELQEKQFFAVSAPEIAQASTADARKKRIAALEDRHPALWDVYRKALRRISAAASLVRGSGRYLLTAHGRLNTYAMFAETELALVASAGRFGLVLPTGIATGDNTAPFFRHLVDTRTLRALLDFENEAKIFPDVDHRVRFALLVATGGQEVNVASFAFSTRYLADVAARRFVLHPGEILLVNPNSGTSPVFRGRKDAEITVGIYRRVPVLWRDGEPSGNLWQLDLLQGLFNMASDSSRFLTEKALRGDGWLPDGNTFAKGAERMLPLYEAKMVHLYDSRYQTYRGQTQAQANQGTLPGLGAEHADPHALPWPRYWVKGSDVAEAAPAAWGQEWLLGWRDVARSVDERTVIATVIPKVGVGHKLPLVFAYRAPIAGLHANLSALVLDYCARQKLSGTSIVYGLVKQLPVLPPERYSEPAHWEPRRSLDEWVTDRVLELSYTGWDLRPYATDLGDNGPPFRWDEGRRAQLRAELDAAYLQLYGLSRPGSEHVLDSFVVLRKNEERAYGEFRTRRLVLAAYDQMAAGAYASPLDPPPGNGRRHPERT